jgi:hypothetical protein
MGLVETTYFLNIPRNVLNFELSSGIFSATAAVGGVPVDVSVEATDVAADGAGEGRRLPLSEPDEDITMRIFVKVGAEERIYSTRFMRKRRRVYK